MAIAFRDGLAGVPTHREGHDVLADGVAPLEVAAHEELEGERVVDVADARLLQGLDGVLGQLAARPQAPEELAEERGPGRDLRLLLRLLRAAALDLRLLHGDVLARLPGDLGGVHRLAIQLAVVGVLLLDEVLLDELRVREVRVLREAEGQLESLRGVLVVHECLLDVREVLQDGLVPLLDGVLEGRVVLQRLQPEARQPRRTRGGVRGVARGEQLLPLLQNGPLPLGEGHLQLRDLLLVLALDGQVPVVDLLQRLDDRGVLWDDLVALVGVGVLLHEAHCGI
mmetsp:Transcript_85169/g.238566  ORF Transcript_85169/g.238566 Transcript_85169/m.238566 type:complete len:283 (-) Transcript_85169:51-899(-)